MKNKKTWIWIASIVGIIAIGVGITLFLKGMQSNLASFEIEEPSVMVQTVKEEELVETILVTGEIVPEDEQKIFLDLEKGEIVEYLVEENQEVKAGDPLFVYDASNLETEIQRAVRERDLIQKQAKTEENQIADIAKRIEKAKKDQSEKDKALANFEKAFAEYEKALAEWEKAVAAITARTEAGEEGEVEDLALPDPPQAPQPPEIYVEDVNQLENEKVHLELQYENTKTQITAAQERVDELEKAKEEMTVVSKIDGVVVKINKNVTPTETGATEPVVHIISNSPYKVIGQMSEFDAVKIQPGQEVIVRPKVYKDREWKGVVESVSQFPDADFAGGDYYGGGGNVTMYPFKVAITEDTSELRQGFHVSLEIKMSGTEKMPVVPHSAIYDEFGTEIVYVMVDGFLERREVQTGSMSDEFIQITAGVSAGELVVINPDERMYDGMEVTSFDEVD